MLAEVDAMLDMIENWDHNRAEIYWKIWADFYERLCRAHNEGEISDAELYSVADRIGPVIKKARHETESLIGRLPRQPSPASSRAPD